MDRVTAVRTVNHKVIDEHASATNLVHTGRHDQRHRRRTRRSARSSPTSAGPPATDVPAYVLIGYPNVSRGPGFLGPKAGYVYLTDTDRRPGRVHPPRRRRRRAGRRAAERCSKRARRPSAATGSAVADYEAAQARGAAAGRARRSCEHFDLTTEPATLRESYGGEFGQRCLLARRLVEAGVRFVEVSHNLNFLNGTGWDIHNEGHRQPAPAHPGDWTRPSSALIADLESAASCSTRR